MKHKHLKLIGLASVVMGLSACATSYDHETDIPNSNGLTGQSGERAVAAITRLNTGDQPELNDISTTSVGN